jgi:uncharacterized secreted protein with C-terminal beta-propeller domain
VVGCLEETRSRPYRLHIPDPVASRAALRAIEDCPDLEQSLKEQMAARMAAELEANRRHALEMYACDDSDESCPGSYPYGYREESSWADDANSGSAPTGASEEAADYSTTNNQVAGVDEADFIKNDGSHVFMVSGDDLVILKAWPAAETTIISQTEIEGWPTSLFVQSDRIAVFSDTGEGQTCVRDPYYGPTTAGGKLKITVFDITDRTAPRLEREIYLSGSYANARRIGDAIHTVVTFPESFELSLATWPDHLSRYGLDPMDTKEAINAEFDQLLSDNLAAVDAADLGDFLPSATDIDYVGGVAGTPAEGLFVDCAGFYEPSSFTNPGFLSVVSFSLGNDTGLGAATIFGRGGEVYASDANLYVAVKDYRATDDPTDHPWRWGEEVTSVHKFALDTTGAEPQYRGSGEVSGRILNQFAMDEHQGRLRIATTEGYLPSPDVTNNIFVLEEQVATQASSCIDGDCAPVPTGTFLAVVGKIGGIGPKEDIRAVRYDGDRGFVVTFKKTDPLFAFDLSDPYNPRVTGELHIPGYSTYMHWMDETHLLTIGFDADDQGGFAWFTGIQLQIFDVSDMSQPTLTFKEVIGTRGTTSDATNDHLAFNYYRTRDLLAIPIGICEDSAGGDNYGTTMTFNGLLVYRVTATGGFELLGGVDHRQAGQSSDYNCCNWWTNPNSQVKRSIFMEDFVYSVSPERLKVRHLPALDTELAEVALPQATRPATPHCFHDW